jgi:hypothetical protein
VRHTYFLSNSEREEQVRIQTKLHKQGYLLPVKHSARKGHIRTPKETKQTRSIDYLLNIE